MGTPWGTGEFLLVPGQGIDNLFSIYDKLVKAELVEIKGSWSAINIDGEVLKFQGWRGLSEKCAENSDLYGKLISIYKSLE